MWRGASRRSEHDAGRAMDRLRFAAVSRNYFNMPVWVAHHAGLFAEEELDVAIELHEPIDEVTRRLRDGAVELAFGVTEHVILDHEANGHLKIIGGNVNKPPFSLIAGKSIKRFEDLRGRTIGVSSIEAGSSSLVMRLLAAHGLLYPQDYTLLAVGPILRRWEMLQSGEIDAGLQGAPLNYKAVDQGFTSLADPRTEFPDFQFTSLNVDSRWAAANRDLLRRFMRAFVRAHRWFYMNRDGATGIAVIEARIPEAYALRAWDEYTAEQIFPADGGVSTAGVATLIEVSALIRAAAGRRAVAAADCIDPTWLLAASRDVASERTGPGG